jgi:site-specific DNA-cytosine methylase
MSDGSTQKGANGTGYDGTGASYTLNTVDRQSVAIATNQRGEVRVDGGDGTSVGAIPASRSGKQMQAVLCMASGLENAEIGHDLGTTLCARQYKDPPIICGETVGALCARDYKGVGSEYVSEGKVVENAQMDATGPRYVVRRLTPRECERLQGFPTEVDLKADEMTSDELIACALANGDITCDLANGKVYGTRGPGGKPLAEKRELGFVHPSGYVNINLSSNGVKKQVRAHRVIYMAANGHIPDGMVVDHINNDKSDNRLCNLQLLTAGENSSKAADDGLYLSGEDNPRSKITAEVRSRIAHDYCTSGMTYRELAQKYGVSKSRIGQIVNECDWTLVPYRGKPAGECPDGPRYKAIGNSMAVPVMRWIGRRIQMVDDDGVGA